MKEKLQAKLKTLPTVQLKEIITGLFDSETDGSGTAMMFALAELEGRVPTAEFVAFCDGF